MIYEVIQHLLGTADKRQVPDAKVGLAQNFGGPGAVASVTILSKD
jgi:hypothetical protein